MQQSNNGWFKEMTKIDFFETSPEIVVPMVCQKIIASKGEFLNENDALR